METLKVVVVGDGAVGKSSLLITWNTSAFPSEYVPTVFDNYSVDRMVNGKPIALQLWDTAGQEDYDRLRPLSYPQTDAFLLCYAVNNRGSFLNIKDKWSAEVQYFCPGTPLILVATKADLKNTDQHETVSYDEGWQMAKDIGAVGFYETSALLYQGLNEAMDAVITAALNSKTLSMQPRRRFRLPWKRKSKGNSLLLSVEPSYPPPPTLPPNEKAPWINVETSTWSQDWGRLVNSKQLADTVFYLETKQFHAHKYVLCSSSDVMRQLFGIKENLKVESLSECPGWTAGRVSQVTPERVNSGQVDGFLSFQEEDQETAETCPTFHITLDASKISEQVFLRCLQFLYTGYIEVDKSSKFLDETISAARLFNLPELEMICQNAKKEEEFLNPSIGTWLNDRNSIISKQLFFHKPLISDVQFRVEGQLVHAHKLVLSTRCEVMAAMLSGHFMESSKQEVEIRDVPLNNFLAFLEYLYTDHSPIEEGDCIGILILSNQYVMKRLMSLCELYITKEVDRACAKSIADADIDVIGLLLTSQLHNAGQLSGWCQHFVASNYSVFEHMEQFSLLPEEVMGHISEHRWPPLAYLEAMEEYRQKHGNEQDEEGMVATSEKGRRERRQNTATRSRPKTEKCSIM